jgi:outer membrane protein OmpA-like peptidoglycan-associated protein
MAAGFLPTPTELKLNEKVQDFSLTDVGLPEAPEIMANVSGFIDKLPEVAAQIDAQLFRGTPKPPAPSLPAGVDVAANAEAVEFDRMVNFELDVSTLDAAAKAELEQVARFLVENEGTRIGIFGHTDLTGPESYNSALGQVRAESVAAFLAELGVSKDRFEVIKSHGEAFPMVETTAPERANRRVMIETM